jgi:hypothetical protein
VIILGMNDPTYSTRRLSLHPKYQGSSGQRLFKIADVPLEEWMGLVTRRNLLRSKTWDQRAANKVGRETKKRLRRRGETIVVLGRGVWQALGFDATTPWFESDPTGQFILIPHPSGVNRLLNDKTIINKIRAILRHHIMEGKPWLRDDVVRQSPTDSSLSARSTSSEAPSTATTTSRPVECTRQYFPAD